MLKLFAKPLVAVALVGLALSAQAQQKLVPAQSEIVFISKQMGVPVDGKFTKFDVQSTFDPKKPEASKVNFTVDLTSVATGAKETEDELKKPGWFDSLKLPNATFASSAVKALGGGKFEIAGKLSIKSLSRDVVVPVTVTQKDGVTRAEGSFTLKRLDFKIGDGEWNDTSLVANDVQVKVKLALTGVPAL
ncbi:MAG: YceI family protein [Burkholderiaceae bacterium]